MERVIIIITEYGKVILPGISNENVWMPEPGLAELFGVIAPTSRVAVGAVYKSGVLKEYEVQKYAYLENGCYADVFGFPTIAAPTFRINSSGTEQVRRAIFERLYLRKEKTGIFFSLVSSNMDSLNYQVQSLLRWRHEVVKSTCIPTANNVFIRTTT